ncbi:MAG: hypothetical protein ACOH2J_16610 [Allorhizobium sp.]
MSSGADDGDEEQNQSTGFLHLPIGDLFLALGSAFLVALLLTRGIGVQGVASSTKDDAVLRIVATEDGLLLPADPSGQPVAIRLDDVFSSRALVERLQTAAHEQRRVLLVIGEHGSESAFLFEDVGHRSGISHILRIRLDRSCRFARQPLSAEGCRDLIDRLMAGA